MALQTTLVDLSFTSGADTKADPKNVGLTTFQTLKNTRYSKIGAAVPRGGFTNFSTLPAATTGATDLVGDNDYIVAKAGTSTYLVGNGANYNRLGDEMPGSYKRIYGGDANAKISSVCIGLGTIFQVWATPDNLTTGNVGVALYELATNRVLAKGIINGFGVMYSVKTVLLNNAIGVYFENSAHSISYTSVNTSATNTRQVISAGNVLNNSPTAVTTLRWTIASNGTTACLLSAADGAVSTKMQIFSNPTSVPVATTTMTFVDPARGLSVCTVSSQGTAAFMTAACSDGSGGSPVAKARFYTTASVQVGSEQTLSLGSLGAPIKCWAYESVTTPLYGLTMTFGTTRVFNLQIPITSTTIGSATNMFAYSLPVSGADVNGLRIMDALTDVTYGSQAMIKMGAFSTLTSSVAQLGVGMNLGSLNNVEQIQLDIPAVSGTKTIFNSPVITAAESLAPPTGTIGKLTIVPKVQASFIVWDTADLSQSFIDRSKQQALYIGTSTRAVGATERPGTVWPEPSTQLSDLSVVAGTRTAATSTISYVWAKVWKSAEGVEYRCYSPIFTAKYTNNTSTLQYVLPTYEFSTYNPDYPISTIELYRTEENGIIFYLAATQMAAGTFTDNSVDTVIVGARTADINGNELPPQAVPSMRAVTNFADRVAMVSADKPSTILFDRPSFYPVGTSTANGLEVEVPTEGGDITAMQDMDSTLYIFKANTISTLYGDPPSATGEGSSLSTPKIIFNGTGCTDPRSAILTPQGIVFRSGKGFYIIARNQQLAFIGEGPFTDRSLVTGAVMSQNQYEVIFTHASGSTWVLNLDTRAWYEWTTAIPIRGVTSSNGQIFFINDTNIVKYDESSTLDLGVSQIAQDIKTGWIIPSHIRGFQRVRRAYIEASCTLACNVTVQVFVDYGSTAVQTFNFNITPNTVNQFDLHLRVQKCESMAFRFLTDKAGLTLSGGTLEVGVKSGTDKSRTSGSNPN